MSEPPAIDRHRVLTQYTCPRCARVMRVVAVRFEVDPQSHYGRLFARETIGHIAPGERIFGCPTCGEPAPLLPWESLLARLGDAWGA